MKPKTLNEVRDERANYYGLQVAYHRWERGPVYNVLGEYNEPPINPDWQTTSVYKSGFDAAVSHLNSNPKVLLEFEAVKTLVEGIRKIYGGDPSPGCEMGKIFKPFVEEK